MTKSRGKKAAPPKAKVSRWFKAAQTGDASAVAQLLEAYRPLLLKLANAQLDPELRQKAPASDLVQNSIIKANLAFTNCNFKSPQDVISWLHEILDNELITAHRRFRKTKKRDARRERPIQSPHAQMWMNYLSLHSVVEDGMTVSRQEETARLSRALEQLPAHYRQVIAWRYSDELPFAKIGEKLDRSGDAARMLWNRALTRLKNEYQKLDGN